MSSARRRRSRRVGFDNRDLDFLGLCVFHVNPDARAYHHDGGYYQRNFTRILVKDAAVFLLDAGDTVTELRRFRVLKLPMLAPRLRRDVKAELERVGNLSATLARPRLFFLTETLSIETRTLVALGLARALRPSTPSLAGSPLLVGYLAGSYRVGNLRLLAGYRIGLSRSA